MAECNDGDYQSFKANDGAYVRKNFFGRDPRALKMVEHMSDDEIWNLRRGGHDSQKVYAAFHAANSHKGQPTVLLVKTDRKSTRLNSSHLVISYAVFCLKKKNYITHNSNK